uniref:STIL centriolar assembly protein n=1 Tax=Xiphophorus couchianus TaxID=32473 RepID=A0A3B5LM63_9TELE
SVGSLAQLAFPKSRLALWDGSAAGQKLRLQLCSHRKPRLVLLEKALRLAQRHARHSNKPRLHCFLLGSLSVNEDEDGVTVTLDRFDPGRDQAGTAAPSALLPGDVLVPCVVVQSETPHDAVVQSEAELHHCFKALQQLVSSRQTLDLSQLLKVKVHVVCRQQADAATFSLSWSAVCPAVPLDVQPVRAVPIIPTALLRALTGIGRPFDQSQKFGFLTMDQSRKLVLLLESDPKASSLPLVGLWLSGVTHTYNPQVWAWSLRFMFGSALQDRVLSELGCFLLVVFGSTHRTPQFFQCRDSRPGPGAQLDFQLLTASQAATLYQRSERLTAPSAGQNSPSSFNWTRKKTSVVLMFSSVARATPPAAGPSVSDQDSGVEDEDFSPRPSPSPHPPAAAQACRVQPSVPELSLLIDGSFSSNHSGGQHSGPAHRLPPANRKSASPTASSSAAQPPPLPHLHSTPNSNLQQPCACCSAHNCTSIFPSPALLPAAVAPHIHHLSTPPLPPSLLPPCSHPSTPPLPSSPLPPCPHAPPAPLWHADPPSLARPPCGNPCCEKVGGVLTSDTYQLLLHQDQQLRLLQAQVRTAAGLSSSWPRQHHAEGLERRKPSLKTQQLDGFPNRTQIQSIQNIPSLIFWCRSSYKITTLMQRHYNFILITLATINPAAVISRLTVSEATGSSLFAGGSVDLSLEANAIALRYLSQSQLSRLSLGGHAPSGCGDSLLSPSNMSLATRKYMRRYGLIEEEEDEEEVRGQEARQPLSDALNLQSLPQSQLIRELRPKMQLLAGTRTGEEKENRMVPVGRTGPNGPQPEGSVGNILDLSRLRQLPKLF